MSANHYIGHFFIALYHHRSKTLDVKPQTETIWWHPLQVKQVRRRAPGSRWDGSLPKQTEVQCSWKDSY